jgi:hypothetical protein
MALHPQLLLAANLEEVLKAIVPLIMMVLWVAGHLMNAKPKVRPPVRQRPLAPPPPNPMAPPAAPGAPAGQGGKPSTLEETLRREVEEFMRRSQGRPQQQSTSQQPQRRPQGGGRPTNPQGPPRRDNRPARPAASQAPPAVRRLTDAPGAQTTAQAPAPTRSMTSGAPGARVAEAVAVDLAGAQALGAHAQQLGAQVAHSEERLQEHLQEKFTHQIGALKHVADQQRKVVRSPAAQELFNLLARPGGMKQIIIASEILRRPVDRWDAPAARDASLRG